MAGSSLILGFSCCKRLSAPWQARDLPHPETLPSPSSHAHRPRVRWDGSCAVICPPSRRTTHRHSHGCQCSPVSWGEALHGKEWGREGGRQLGLLSSGQRMPATEATCAQKKSHGAQSQHCVWSLTAKPWSCGAETTSQEHP